ncbi:MAG: integrase core domain-containing protein, partial [Roseibium sp.]|uniref:integrase core domain-containing protein n=1 Tax=Roseibium sp. TaxID=1936156 RepID=UPI003296CFF3
PDGPNDVWSIDFLSDQLFDGRKIRVLTIVDAFSKVSPAIDVRPRYTGADVVATLERVTADYGVPGSIRVDNGPEFISRDLDLWAYMDGVVLDFSRPGKPTDNSFVEAFNGKVRAECIDQNWFLSLEDARLKCEAFRQDYNHIRPHSSIGFKTPVEFMKSIGNPNQPVVP